MSREDISVIVNEVEPNKTPTVTLTADKTNINSGESTTIRWSSIEATSCNAKPNSDNIGESGSFETGPLTTSKSYTVTCTGAGGVSSDSISVVVVGNSGIDTLPTVSVNANKESFSSGEKATINWVSAKTQSCTNIVSNNTSTSGYFSTETLTQSMTYTVTCIGLTGSASGSINIIVNGTNTNTLPEVTMVASPTSVTKGGVSTITWESTNSDYCKIDMGSEEKGKEGFFNTESLVDDKSYAVICTKESNGSRSSATVYVFVDPEIVDPEIECNDGEDNDGNGDKDIKDPQCHKDGDANNAESYDPTWNSESTTWTGPQCNNGLDDDGDGFIDMEDSDCESLDDDNENGDVPPPAGDTECSDDKSNDTDSLIDEEDPQCYVGGAVVTGKYLATHNSETKAPTECNDTLDNNQNGEGDSSEPNCYLGGIKEGGTYVPTWDSESDFPTKCTDGTDNDNDGDVDNFDSGCYPDGDITKTFNPKWNDETTAEITPNICLNIEQNPITFTPEEKARLDTLLRKFYLISSTLKTTEDISAIYSEIEQQQHFMSQTDELTKQCYLEVNDEFGFYDFCSRNKSLCDTPASSGDYGVEFAKSNNDAYSDIFYGKKVSTSKANPNKFDTTPRRGNPWYQPSYPTTTPGNLPFSHSGDVSYIDYNWLEGNYIDKGNGNFEPNFSYPKFPNGIGPGCKAVSGYYYGCEPLPQISPTRNANNCSYINTRIYEGDAGSSYPEQVALDRGCKWKDGVDLVETEKILNIW
jgi:hypothetical protein